MPFAGYDTFDSCVNKNKTKGDPKAYCGKIKHKVEDITLKENEPFSILYDPPVGSVYNEPTVPPLTMKVPDTGYPPEKPYEPYLSEPYPPLSLNYSPIPQDDQQNRNYVATGSKLESQPSMHNEEGWTANKDPPIDTQGLNINPNDIIFEPPMEETTFSDKIEKQRDLYLFGDDDKPHMVTDGNDDNDTELHIHLELPEFDLEVEDIEENEEYERTDLMLDLEKSFSFNETEWDEGKHPRDEAGKFTSGNLMNDIGRSNNEQEEKLGDNLTKIGIDDDKQRTLLASFSRTTDPNSSLQGAIQSDWEYLAAKSPEVAKEKEALEKYEQDVNNAIQNEFENTESIYRGTAVRELKQMAKNGRSDPYLYNYLSFTMDKEAGIGFGRNNNWDGVTVEYNKDEILNQENAELKPVNYSVYTNYAGTGEEKDKPYPVSFADEAEVRSNFVMNTPNAIKSITLHKNEFHDTDFPGEIDANFEELKTLFPNAKVTIREQKLIETEPITKGRSPEPHQGSKKAFTHSSSWVGNVRYNPQNQTMRVMMNNKGYGFCGVPEKVYDSWEGAPSKGEFWWRNIKDRYNCSSLSETQVIRESIGQIRHEFSWLSDEYLDRVKKVNSEGKWYLIRASAETITDHRSEGETHRRKLDGDELHAMARTAINHSMDINHLGEEYKTDALIADSEYDKKRKEVQMLVHESDPEIIDGVRRGDITAVSINGGAPRDTKVECEDTECFNVPRGVVLGELDDIALTWVVTKQSGFRWRGKHIPYAKPGVGTTVIEPLN